MTIQLIVYWYWSNIVIINADNEGNKRDYSTQDEISMILLVVISVYQIILELVSAVRRSRDYLDMS